MPLVRRRVGWLSLVAGVLLACGGRATSQPRETAQAGAAGTGVGGSATAGAMARGGHAGTTSELTDAPSSVTLVGASGSAEGPATPSMLGPCFRGFTAEVDGMRVDLEAFVQAPGDYQGDPVHILYLAAYLPDGRIFSASTNSEPYGEIDLHVVSVTPRFVGAADALLYDRADPAAPPFAISLTFDVAAGRECG